jgi:hypothetical protein
MKKPNHCGLIACAFILVCIVSAFGADSAEVKIRAAQDHIDFLVGTELVGRYHHGPGVAKPYLWPVNGPGGRPMTRGWPMEKSKAGGSVDHPWQKSVWFCHGDVNPQGLPIKHKAKGIEGVDFWSESPSQGCIVLISAGAPKEDKNHAGIRTRNEWRTAHGDKILDETRGIELYDFTDTRLFIFDIDLHASVAPVEFGDTKEGSFGVRVNDEIREKPGHGKIENADGLVGEKNCWGRQSAWCDYSGEIDGKTVGLATLDDSANPYPACWHVRSYGLMAANPFGRKKSGFPAMKDNSNRVLLAPGQHLNLRYGLLIHPGDAKAGKVAEYYQRFVKMKRQK